METRRTNKRTRRNRGRFGFLYKLFSFLLVLVVIVAGCVIFFRVEEVTVAGHSQYTAEQIIAASGIEQGDNLFLLNKFQAARRILTSLPYVDEISIRRALPDGLLISVSECVPTLLIQGEGAWWVADGKGKLLQSVPTAPYGGTAKVTGIAALSPAAGTMLVVEPLNTAKLDTLLAVCTAFQARGMMEKVSAVDLTGSARLTLTYDSRFRVELPMTGDFERAAWALETIVGEQLQSNDAGRIDMTSVGQPKEQFVFSTD